MATLNDTNYEKGLDLTRARTRLGINGDAKEGTEDASAKAARKKQANILAIDALKQGTGQIKVDVKSVFMFLLKDGERHAALMVAVSLSINTMCRHLDHDPTRPHTGVRQTYLRPATSARHAAPFFR